MSNQFPNDNDNDFDASDVETEPMDTNGSDVADGAFGETLGDGGSITDPLLVGASGPDGAGTGLGGPMDAPTTTTADDRDGSVGEEALADGAVGDGSAGDASAGDGSAGDASAGAGALGDESTGDGALVDESAGDGALGEGSAGDGHADGGATGDGFAGEDVTSEDVQSSLRSTAPDQERSAAADSPDATIPTAAGDDIPSGARDGGDS